MAKPVRKRRANYMEQADRLFSQQIRTRDGACRKCGTRQRLQCAHIISRSYKNIRVDPDNAVALCASCHVFFTHRPIEWEIWVEDEFPGRLAHLRKKALAYERVDWKNVVRELKDQP